MYILTRFGLDAVNDMLGITLDPYTQDWEIEVSDPRFLPEICTILEQGVEDIEILRALFALQLSSLDDYLRLEGGAVPEGVDNCIRKVLLRYRIHVQDILEYWEVEDAEGPDDEWAVSPYLRTL